MVVERRFYSSAYLFPGRTSIRERPGDISSLWEDLSTNIDKRIQSYINNISLLRISAEDARADRIMWAERSDGDDTVDFEYGGEVQEVESKETSPTMRQSFTGLLAALSAASRPDTLPIARQQLASLIRDVQEVMPTGIGEGFIRRPEDFYLQLHHAQGSDFLPNSAFFSTEDIRSIQRAQTRLNGTIVSCIDGSDRARDLPDNANATRNAEVFEDMPAIAGIARVQLEVGPYRTYTEMAYQVASTWTLNKLQTMVVVQLGQFMDKWAGIAGDGQSEQQYLQHLGGAGGTGKSRVVDAIKELFRLKDQDHLVLITASSGSAAAKIGGVTIHSACKLGVDDSGRRVGRSNAADNVSEETRWRWKQKLVLVIDEVSMIGGSTLDDIDERIRMLRGDQNPFGGMPVVLLCGDFYQFGPVKETNLLLGMSDLVWNPQNPRDVNRVRKHQKGHQLFKRFKNVVMLKEQVRASGCATLSGFLSRLREGRQTEADFQALAARFSTQGNISFKDGLRAITPLNAHRWGLNIAAVVEWARSRSRHISIFLSTHSWDETGVGVREMIETIGRGDDSSVAVPGIFVYAQGMPAILTRNALPGLKMVNGAEFDAVVVIPDPAFPGYHVADDVTVHFGPPQALILQSEQIKDLAVDGLPTGTVMLKGGQTVVMDTKHAVQGLSKCRRTGPTCTPGFVMTDYKAQGRTFDQVLLELKGKLMTTSGPSKCDPMSLYVQLSRATHWEGIRLRSELRRKDFIEPKNEIDPRLRKGMEELQKLDRETRCRFEQECRRHQGSWFHDWQAMSEGRPPAAPDNEAPGLGSGDSGMDCGEDAG